MNDLIEKSVPTGYRFLDEQEDHTSLQRSDSGPSVEFYPAIDDLVYITRTNQKVYKLTSYAKSALLGFLLLNVAGMPAVLFYFDRLAAAFIVCLLNIVFSIFVLPKIMTTDYRRFFKTMHVDFENEIARVELNEEGVICRARGNMSFHAWRNVKRIEESAEAIYFFLAGTGFAVRKNGFAYDQQKDEFLTFARNHLRQSPLIDAANHS